MCHFGTQIDYENKLVKWQHIVDLYKHQKTEGFTLANKLTKQHIEFHKNPMKVRYAVQVLSRSVANALLTLRDLDFKNFRDVYGTSEYLLCFDSIFDVMNSRSLSQSFQKAPMKEKNEESWQTIFRNSWHYICNLKTVNGKSVLYSNRYAAFLGMKSTF